MSGGHWDYQTDRACNEVFGWQADAVYGIGDGKHSAGVKWARKINPLEDKQLSEMVYDVFCLLHSYDWYISADTCEDTYRKDVEYFKNKWLKEADKMLVKREINQTLAEAKEELYKALGYRKMSELKPCPFCGSTKLKVESKHNKCGHTASVRCNKCYARGGAVSGNKQGWSADEATRQKAKDLWNKRAMYEIEVKVID